MGPVAWSGAPFAMLCWMQGDLWTFCKTLSPSTCLIAYRAAPCSLVWRTFCHAVLDARRAVERKRWQVVFLCKVSVHMTTIWIMLPTLDTPLLGEHTVCSHLCT